MQRRREIRLSACKIDIQPARRFIQNRRALFFARFRQIGRKIFRAIKPESRQSRIVRGEQHAAQRGIVMLYKKHMLTFLITMLYYPIFDFDNGIESNL